MSKTPRFDQKIATIIDALPEGRDKKICRKFQVPPITMQPDKLLDYLNGFNTGLAFFWKPHMTTGQPLLSAIHPDNPIPIVTEDEWANADYTDRGASVDSSRSIFDQLWQLATTVPYNPTRSVNAVNSIAVGSIDANDCYCVSAAHIVNRCFYAYALVGAEDCVDAGNGMQLARSYRCGGSNELADCAFVFESKSCHSSSFLFDCWNCEFCFGATNQRNKRYIFFNQQLTKEAFEEKMRAIDLGDATQAEEYWQSFLRLWKTDGVWPEALGYGNTDAKGEHLFGCVRCDECYWQSKSIDCYRCRFGVENNGCVYTSGEGFEQDSYMCTGGTYGAQNKFCVGPSKCVHCEYCFNCRDCEYCFACVGLQHKKFCIFNKQYTEAEYWPLIDELKCKMLADGEYGSFFEARFSPSGFQYSAGELYVGYSPERLREYGAPTFDPRRGQVLGPQPVEAQRIEAADVPTRLDDPRAAEVIGKVIHDSEIDRNFTIVPAEFAIYKDKRWPLPRKHFVTRLTELVRLSNSPIKEMVNCGSCALPITTYKNFSFPERMVYCYPCYLKFLETR